MRKIIHSLRLSVTYLAALLLAVGYPLSAMAQTPEATDSQEQVTSPTVVEPEKTYTFNEQTGLWDSNKWQYDPTTTTYQPVPVQSVPETPATPLAEAAAEDQPADISSETPPQSDSSSASATETGIKIDNQIISDALTGNSAVTHNTTAGNATTGNAAATATIVNNVNSVISAPENQKVANFTYDVMGDTKGDIMLYPLLLKSMLEAQAPDGSSPASNVTVRQDASVTNDVTLRATSGNASVTGNTSAGNASTGSAHTVANVVNIVDSMINANQSFIGTVNIYGNLEGDILIAPDFIPQMIANNSATGGTVPERVDAQTTTEIVNNISLAAQSGGASVFGNTQAGDATSGSADTNVVIFNLTGHEIMAEDSVLVFINVLGKWVGVIVDAPTGATAAMVGSGVSSHSTPKPDLQIDATVKNGITNNITLESRTGDAVVAGNTQAGNATSGNASASANVANIAGTRIGTNRAFITLFINVWGTWNGSFGVDTAFGNSPVESGQPGRGGVNETEFITHTRVPPEQKRVTLIDTTQLTQPSHPVTIQPEATDQQPAANSSTDTRSEQPVVLGSADVQDVTAVQPGSFDYRLAIVAGSLLLVGLSGLGLKWLYRTPRAL